MSDLNAAEPDFEQTEGEKAVERSALEELILDSGLFDIDYYNDQTGKEMSASTGVRHYLDKGERSGFFPSPRFDPSFYAISNSDVSAAGVNCLGHYLISGRAEGRSPNRLALQEFAILVQSDNRVRFLDRSTITLQSGNRPGLTVLEAYLGGGWRNSQTIFSNFDDQLYSAYYGDEDSDIPPIVQYLLAVPEPFPLRAYGTLDQIAADINSEFDQQFYCAHADENILHQDALRHYIMMGSALGFDPNAEFSVRNYLSLYPDILVSNMEPFWHFLLSGRSEGRRGKPTFPTQVIGDIKPSQHRRTILIATHEASRTGAPLVALGLVKALSEIYNVITLSLKGGAIFDEFKLASTQVFQGDMNELEAELFFKSIMATESLYCCLFNSAECHALARGAHKANVPSVGLVHEFAEYSSGHVQVMIESVDEVVFPAALLTKSAKKELALFGDPSNLSVRHQGVLPILPYDADAVDLSGSEILAQVGATEHTKIILGAGWSQIRKGLDLFVQTAEVLSRIDSVDFRFIWVGENYRPQEDMAYSVYVSETLNRLDMRKHVHFLPAQSSLDILLSMADVFFLPSRLDPYPNVVLDAWEAGLPVVCFKGATGVAEEIENGNAVGAAVRYTDVAAAAAAIQGFLAEGRESGASNIKLMDEKYNFDDYAEYIKALFAVACELKSDVDLISRQLLLNGEFDPDFYTGGRIGGAKPLELARQYVSNLRKGLTVYNPRRGFSANLSMSGLNLVDRNGGVIEPAGNLRSSNIALTHSTVALNASDAPANQTLRITLYVESCSVRYLRKVAVFLKDSDRKLDVVLLSPLTEAQRIEVLFVFSSNRNVQVRFTALPDADATLWGPLSLVVQDLDTHASDIVGVLSDRSGDFLSSGSIQYNDWLDFNLNTLLGDKFQREQIWALLYGNTGLIFAEDRHSYQWIDRTLSEVVATNMELGTMIPQAPFHPIGSNFWAKPEAFKRFTQSEPFALVAEGRHDLASSLRDTVCQLIPSICQSSGYEWCTVYVPGVAW